MFGFEREDEMAGRPIGDFVAPEDRDRALSAMALMFEGVLMGPTEYRALRSDGGTFDADVSSELIRDADGRPTSMVFTVRDTTERKAAEAALRESEELLEESQRVARVGHYVLDLRSGTWTSSPVLDDIYGIDENYVRSGSPSASSSGVPMPRTVRSAPSAMRAMRNSSSTGMWSRMTC